VANFIRRMKRGTIKYKGMLPMKFFIVMVLVIFLINFPAIKRKVMKKMTLKRKRKYKRVEETRIFF
jgi:hypothetical protein